MSGLRVPHPQFRSQRLGLVAGVHVLEAPVPRRPHVRHTLLSVMDHGEDGVDELPPWSHLSSLSSRAFG